MGLSINIMKTETMCVEPIVEFFTDGKALKNIKCFKYLGNLVTYYCSIKEELTSRI